MIQIQCAFDCGCGRRHWLTDQPRNAKVWRCECGALIWRNHERRQARRRVRLRRPGQCLVQLQHQGEVVRMTAVRYEAGERLTFADWLRKVRWYFMGAPNYRTALLWDETDGWPEKPTGGCQCGLGLWRKR